MSDKQDYYSLPTGCDDESTAGAALSTDVQLAFSFKVGQLGKDKVNEIIETEGLLTKRDFVRHEYGSIKNALEHVHNLAVKQDKQQSRLPKTDYKLSASDRQKALNRVKVLKDKNLSRSDEDVFNQVGTEYGVVSRTIRRLVNSMK
ncbi:MAG: hypothetical protein DIZ80_10435 [endosymbiont of Galathealinum brachiosum]|uniref:Uncharacterized protein n=1 Tax=endosymbiont of Galathealinum brachiosum TaxID=2200906 RepID=A0A370DCR1_9GAMM|nr:MAG: hypothetical protein DIZ80_10435 [endosymbiont of Galathealinum brachiosum]